MLTPTATLQQLGDQGRPELPDQALPSQPQPLTASQPSTGVDSLKRVEQQALTAQPPTLPPQRQALAGNIPQATAQPIVTASRGSTPQALPAAALSSTACKAEIAASAATKAAAAAASMQISEAEEQAPSLANFIGKLKRAIPAPDMSTATDDDKGIKEEGGTKKKTKNEKTSEEAKKQKEFRDTEMLMTKTISALQSSSSQALEIEDSIKNNTKWKWLSNTPQYDLFAEAQAKIEEAKAASPLVKTLLVNGNKLGHHSAFQTD